mmetsp:Transcript_17957/g.51757  ORF Transcript_17957/g.51757 Transcript_17957/m.51757 type:complete len:211 (+) Transcript_17957:398-1030(+)
MPELPGHGGRMHHRLVLLMAGAGVVRGVGIRLVAGDVARREQSGHQPDDELHTLVGDDEVLARVRGQVQAPQLCHAEKLLGLLGELHEVLGLEPEELGDDASALGRGLGQVGAGGPASQGDVGGARREEDHRRRECEEGGAAHHYDQREDRRRYAAQGGGQRRGIEDCGGQHRNRAREGRRRRGARRGVAGLGGGCQGAGRLGQGIDHRS